MAINALPNGAFFAVGDYAGVYHFDPQTQTWDSLGTPAGISGYHLDIKFLDSDNGFFRTADGGISWTPELDINTGGFKGLHFVDKNNGYAFDNANRIYRRTATSGIADVKSEITITFSPNPVTSTLSISRKSGAFSNQDILFSLYDVTGRRVLQQILTGETTLVSCAHLADGIYWYECGGEVGKVIVARV